MGKKLFLVFWQLSSCCILTCRRRASEVSSYNDINPIHEGLSGWKSQREEGRRRKRQRERTESLSKKFVKGERKRVVFQERHGRWKFSFKRSALTLKSQVEGFIWEPGDHTITSHLRRSRQSLSYLTEAFDVVHTSQWDFTCQYRRLKRRVQSLGGEDPLEKDKATHCSILAWRIPWTEERGRLQSIGLQRVWYEWSNLVLHTGENTATWAAINSPEASGIRRKIRIPAVTHKEPPHRPQNLKLQLGPEVSLSTQLTPLLALRGWRNWSEHFRRGDALGVFFFFFFFLTENKPSLDLDVMRPLWICKIKRYYLH